MLRYAVKRLLLAIPTVLGILTLVFILLHVVPGDPVRLMMGDAALPQDVAALRHEYGLDRPLPVQYLDYLGHAVRGDFGESLKTGLSVTGEVFRVFPHTVLLAVFGLLITILIGIPIGVTAAVRSGTIWDYGSMGVSLIGLSVPTFWLAVMMILVFSVKLDWLPITGGGSFSQPLEVLKRLILPAVTLGISTAAFAARMTRSCMLEVLAQDYVRTARAKGLPEGTVVYRHALKNAAIPIVTTMGILLSRLLGGAVVLEMVFSRPGIGQLIVSGILARDYPLVQGTVAFFALVLIAVNLGVDLVYAFLDPTIRFD